MAINGDGQEVVSKLPRTDDSQGTLLRATRQLQNMAALAGILWYTALPAALKAM